MKFKTGDKVWIENPELVDDVKQIRETQEVESIDTIRTNEGPLQSIILVGLPYMYLAKDLKHERRNM